MGSYCCKDSDQQPLVSVTNNAIVVPFQQPKQSNMAVLNSTRRLEPSRKAPKEVTDKYQYVSSIGRGPFGQVLVVEEKATGCKYAMKVIGRDIIQEQNMLQCQLIREVCQQDILVAIKQTLQNEINFYVIMEYLPKGDLYFYLCKKEFTFTEDVIRALAAQVIYGLQVLHGYQIIYRQLKPENVMITNSGHIKLTDYGLSKCLKANRDFSCTFTGAKEYVAPEAVDGNYGIRSDLWTLGIFLYELQYGQPFTEQYFHSTPKNFDQRQKEINAKLERLPYTSQILKDLLNCLLQVNPEKRIGLDEVKKHGMFKGIDWTEVKERRNKPPLADCVAQNNNILLRDPNSAGDFSHRQIHATGRREDYTPNLYEFEHKTSV